MAEVRLEVDVAHPPERVWRALTDASILGEWFMLTDLEPREGGMFTLEPGELSGFLGPVSGEVSELDPPQRIAMLWQGEKLHTRVVWELAETADGCRVRVLQSGFIGAPASLRRRALRATYTTLFADRLPAVLDQLVADEAAPTRAAVPRQRGEAVTTPVGIGLGIRQARSGDPAAAVAATTGSLAAAAVEAAEAARIPAQRTGAEPDGSPVPQPAAGGDEPPPGRRAVGILTGWTGWRRRLGVLPAWGRALAIGAAAAVLAIAVLAAVVQPVAPELKDDPIAGQGDGPLGPDTGVQPGISDAVPEGAASASGRPGAGASGDETPGPQRPSPARTAPATSGAEPTTPGSTGTPGSVPPVPESQSVLEAEVTTSSRLLGLSGSTVSVTVANPGPADAETWQVSMDVGEQSVTNVSGAQYVQDGSAVTFTPAEGLAAGDSTTFSFDIPGGLLGLGGAADPTDCTIDGNPC